jgi:hypothetical protein
MERLVTSHPLGSWGNWDCAGTEMKADAGRDVVDAAAEDEDVGGGDEVLDALDGGDEVRGEGREGVRWPRPQ